MDMDERQDSRISEKNGKDRTAASGERIRMEEAIRPDRDDEMMRRREAARQKRREERMRAIRMQRMVFLGVAAVLLIVVIIVAVSCARRNRDSEMNQSSAGSGQTSDASGTAAVSGDGSGGDSSNGDVSGGDASSDSSGGGEEASGQNVEPAAEGQSAAQTIQQAQLLAAGYDYDGAIALLEGIKDQDPSVADTIASYNDQKARCVAVDVTRIPHVFFHSLINDDRAFNAELVGADRVRQNNAAMTTTAEFDAMIQDMYEAGYVMVGLDDMCIKTTDENGVVHIAKNDALMLPPEKKAFVLSIDDLSYYHSYGIGTQGYATRMLVDENGRPKCEYTNEEGVTTIGDYDVVPRIDTFIEQHPDFSYRGARGTVAMTGYNGVFGYRTNNYYKDINDPHLDPDQIQWLQDHPDFNWEEDCANAKAVADAMKAEGWTFASHTYGHLNAESADLARLQADHERWVTVNEPILGKVDKIIFAFGADIGHVGEYTDYNEKFQYFKNQGMNIFCNVDGNIGWTEFGDTFMRTGRVALDGFTMYQAMTEYAGAHTIYANDYEALGISGIADFFNKLRPTPIDSE
jgi:hypothetical protein